MIFKNYIVLTSSTTSGLQVQVREFMEKKYMPLAGPSYGNGVWAQAMVQNERD